MTREDTHEAMRELLAGYVLDALEEEEAVVLARHLESCAVCQAELSSLQNAVDFMAQGVPQLAAPERLRARVVPPTNAPAAVVPTMERLPRHLAVPMPNIAIPRVRSLSLRVASLAAAVALVLLSAITLATVNTVRQQDTELAESRAALGLLTSTETENNRLERDASWLPADAHGHWFHRSGVDTQVVVGEWLPTPPAGQHYEVWMHLPSGWVDEGTIHVDRSGYGRLVILGSDGERVSELRITLEAQRASGPGPDTMLRYLRPAE